MESKTTARDDDLIVVPRGLLGAALHCVRRVKPDGETYQRLSALAMSDGVPAVIAPGDGMARYIGTKAVNAKPMTRLDYNNLRGWQLPADEDGSDAGYLVEYADGQRPNVDGYQGYVSWSPADVFERSYRAA